MSRDKTILKTTRHVYQGLGTAIIVFTFTCTPVSSCSMMMEPRFSISSDNPVFVGHVGAYLESISMDGCLPGETYTGFTVSVESVLGGPSVRGQRVELFPYGLSTSCGARPLRTDELKSRYPPGAKIRVVAEYRNPCHGADPPKQEGYVRLFASDFFGGIAPVAPSDPDPAASEPFDYSLAAGTRERPRGDAVDFEVVKDLLRLTSAKTERGRAKIVRRLMALPDYRDQWCEQLVKNNILVGSEAQRLIEACHAEVLEVHP